VQLPIFQTSNQDLSLMETKWASIINPVLSNPLTNPTILNGVKLASGANVINHTLGATPQGWIISDIDGNANIYRTQPFNNLTLTLYSTGAVTVNLVIY